MLVDALENDDVITSVHDVKIMPIGPGQVSHKPIYSYHTIIDHLLVISDQAEGRGGFRRGDDCSGISQQAEH